MMMAMGMEMMVSLIMMMILMTMVMMTSMMGFLATIMIGVAERPLIVELAFVIAEAVYHVSMIRSVSPESVGVVSVWGLI